LCAALVYLRYNYKNEMLAEVYEVFKVVKSKAWEWSKENRTVWLEPSEESYYIAKRWENANFKTVLDFGCGLGRHAICFAEQGFRVFAFDLSEDAKANLSMMAERKKLSIDIRNADMLNLPYEDDSMDCIFAYHVVSHTDTAGAKKILSEMARVLKPGGEVFLTLCSKETWSFKDAGYPKLDENTVIKTDDGPEKGIPHFFVALDEIAGLFTGFNLIKVRHTDDCFFDGRMQNSKHYFILASL